jgi:hypothetical protein
MDNFDEILYRIIRRNRRVIIPDIGAFINNSSDENIVFSPFLKHSDGFLEEEMQKEGIDSPTDFLKEFAENVILTTDNGQRYNIAGLGYFFKDGSIRFAFEQEENAGNQKHTVDTTIVYLPEKEKSRRNTGIIMGVVCLCLIAFGCLLFMIFNMHSSDDSLDPLISQTEKPGNRFIIIDKSGDYDETDGEPDNLQLLSMIKSYHVVVAFFEEKINAENFVLQCRKMGYDKAEILSVTGILYPVSIGGFTSHDEALGTKHRYDSIYKENSLIYKMK